MSEELSVAAAPKWYKPVAIIALIWNLLGLAAFFMVMTLTKESMDAAGMTAEQQELMNSTPQWVNAAFAVGVVCGVLGCIGLILRKKVAFLLLAFSLVGVLAQCTWIYFLSDAVKVMGVGLSPVTIIVSIALTVLGFQGTQKGWLR